MVAIIFKFAGNSPTEIARSMHVALSSKRGVITQVVRLISVCLREHSCMLYESIVWGKHLEMLLPRPLVRPKGLIEMRLINACYKVTRLC